jgi:hypothetical protein
VNELAEALALVGDAAGVKPPSSVRSGVLARALATSPATVVSPCAPVAAYRGAADDLLAVLEAVGDHELLAHVAGVEELVLRWLADDPVEVDDHLAVRSTRTSGDWLALTHQVVAAAEDADPASAVHAYGLDVDVEGLLVLRIFELWTHTEDLCRSTGFPPPAPDPARMALLSSRLAEVLPLALAVRDTPAPGRTARLVLTGIAPGCFDVPLAPGEEPGEPDVTVVVDVVDICRVAARRADAAAVTVSFEGDEALGRLVLAAANAFAQD